MKVIDINGKNSLQCAASVFEEGGILVFPTDTVYGIGCLINQKTIKRLYQIKQRPLSQPTAILMSRKVFGKTFQGKINNQKFFEGKLTLLLSRDLFKTQLPKILIKNGKVGIRLPQYPWLEKIIDKVGPIVASSANKKGERPPTKFEAIDHSIIKQLDLAVIADQKISGKPSRVYDIELGKYIR